MRVKGSDVATDFYFFINPLNAMLMIVDHKKFEHHSFLDYLVRAGIKPTSFAYFLSQYIKRKPAKKKSVLSMLLSQELKAQAELIVYHLNR
jgi:hypothetical protein